ncbi:hypothetical protein N657DRAFT_371169 [Parathielavia appendiculata]|uniref:Uncharacterized protein n=1 Tax=Parathielavia appendiculata TaxID=2587402 RepID=A0AAN6TPY0_9PEZI|nr:hypothetical protein N657DRAFT_371169 [Parathielavia appendiculata]
MPALHARFPSASDPAPGACHWRALTSRSDVKQARGFVASIPQRRLYYYSSQEDLSKWVEEILQQAKSRETLRVRFCDKRSSGALPLDRHSAETLSRDAKSNFQGRHQAPTPHAMKRNERNSLTNGTALQHHPSTLNLGFAPSALLDKNLLNWGLYRFAFSMLAVP